MSGLGGGPDANSSQTAWPSLINPASPSVLVIPATLDFRMYSYRSSRVGGWLAVDVVDGEDVWDE